MVVAISKASIRRIGALSAVTAVTSSSACSPDAQPSGIIRTDSAGVEVIVHPAGRAQDVPAWTLSPDPVVEIGSGPGITVFRVTAVAPLSEDRVAIGMTAPPQVVVVRAGSPRSTQIGRPGEGPGEFAGVESVVPLPGDSIAVWDPERRRISVFDRGGSLLREVDLRDEAPLSWIAAPDVTAASARTELLPAGNGGFWLYSVGVMGPGQGVFRPGAPSYRIAPDGEVLAKLAVEVGDEAFHSEQFGAIPNPLGAVSQGSAVGESLAVASGSGPELQIFGPDGSERRRIRWTGADLDLEPGILQVWEGFLEEHLASLPGEEAGFRREALAAIPPREELPKVGQVLGTDTGELWVGPYVPGQQVLVKAFMGEVPIPSTRWLVFGVDGELIATVSVPAGFVIHAVNGGRVWGVHRDGLDVESVRAYALQRV